LIRGRLTDAEWAFFEPFLIATGPKRGRPPADHRRVLDGIFWIARTGAPWRDLPEELGKWSSVYRQFLRWTRAGLWDILLETMAKTEAIPDTLQMIDSTIVRAHHHAAGGRGGFRETHLAVRAAGSRPKSISVRTRKASRLRPRSHRVKRMTSKATRR
jgi:transposase